MNLSFEFFPPRTKKNEQDLKQVRIQLSKVCPEYFSVTYGAAGSSQKFTIKTILDIKKNDNVLAVPHLSCVDSRKDKIISILNQYKNAGINNLIVLRGDMPSGMYYNGDFNYANELIEFIRQQYDDYFYIRVGCYPETHPQAKNFSSDLKYFVNKIKAGASSAITQYFYNIDAYFYFIEEVEKLDVDVTITPGIMPITNYRQLVRFSAMCGTEIPKWILQRLKFYENDQESLILFGEEVVCNLCQKLKSQGVASLHFYSMNKAYPLLRIIKNIM